MKTLSAVPILLATASVCVAQNASKPADPRIITSLASPVVSQANISSPPLLEAPLYLSENVQPDLLRRNICTADHAKLIPVRSAIIDIPASEQATFCLVASNAKSADAR